MPYVTLGWLRVNILSLAESPGRQTSGNEFLDWVDSNGKGRCKHAQLLQCAGIGDQIKKRKCTHTKAEARLWRELSWLVGTAG